MAISKRLRYEVLKRDGHRCYYCGATAAEAKLVVDAVVPEALGGSHKDPANLVTACEPCNSGKTSTNPDAPLVAAVAEDAARWAQAMKSAQAAVLSDRSARAWDHADFKARWETWGYGSEDERHTLPLPGGWEASVDNILAAGLPREILLDCIDLAMSRTKVKHDQMFRYMCGIAWNKVDEIQAAARAIVGGESSQDATAAPSEADRYQETIRYLLDFFTPNDRAEAEAEVAEDEDQPPAERREQAILEHAIIGATTGFQWLQCEVLVLLDHLPDGIGIEAQHLARVQLYDEYGATFTKAQFIEWAANRATELLCPAKPDAEVPF